MEKKLAISSRETLRIFPTPLDTRKLPLIAMSTVAKALSKCLAIFVCIPLVVGAPTEIDKEDGFRETPDGQLLIGLGEKYNKPLWEVIGKAIINEVNKQNHGPCGIWTEWSYCDYSSDPNLRIGARARSRKCKITKSVVEQKETLHTEQETELCKSKCPKTYTLTKHGFCLRLSLTKADRDAAEKNCQTEGGHLVNIDSMIKVEDVNETLGHEFPETLLYIDGRRSKQAGPFSYGYPMVDPSFTFWGDNDPDNSPTELCMAYQKDHSRKYVWRLYDYYCTTILRFMCEIQ